MKALFSSVLFFILSSGNAQFQVDTLFKNGPLAKHINLVFLSDGYQESELDKFILDTETILNEIFTLSPFKEYKSYFNAFAVRVPSNQSGASHPQTSADPDCAPIPVATVDNYFGSQLDSYGIHRLLVPTKNVGATLATNFPLYDQAFIVVNSEHYGGSGGTFATASIHQAGIEIAIHEIGHSFALLADEYWAGPGYATEKPNMTKETNTAQVKWKNWIGVKGTGIYAHEEGPSWNRPHQNCKMRYLGSPFCPVCSEAFTERIHSLVNPLNGYEPTTTEIDLGTENLEFSVSLIKPTINTLKVVWKNNGTLVASNQESLTIPTNKFNSAKHIIRAEIIDTTSLSKISSHQIDHLSVVEWTVHTDLVTGLEIVASVAEYSVETYPLPFTNEFTLTYKLSVPTRVTGILQDQHGKNLAVLVNEHQPAGNYVFTISETELTTRKPGMYFLHLTFNGASVVHKIIKM